MAKIYDFKALTSKGKEIDFSQFQGKVLLIVNTASKCGFTPQFAGLEELNQKYKGKGLVIVGFPCNQFKEQAPGTDEEIHTFCKGRFGITFPQFSKIDVIGDNADPLFKYLSANTKFEGFGAKGLVLGPVVKSMDKDYKNNGNVKWNFTKFLIGRDGEILARFEPTTGMGKVREAVAKAIE